MDPHVLSTEKFELSAIVINNEKIESFSVFFFYEIYWPRCHIASSIQQMCIEQFERLLEYILGYI